MISSNKPVLLPVLRTPKALLVILSVLTAVSMVGAAIFFHARSVMAEQLKARLVDVASVAAVQFQAAEVQGIAGGHDAVVQLQYKEVVQRLDAVRRSVTGIKYTYLLRRTDDPNQMEFIADADGLRTPRELDKNHNGVVDSDEQPSYPGDRYDVSQIPALKNDAWTQAVADDAVTYDQWGATISGYAPIKNAKGITVGVLGVDMDAGDFIQQSQQVFSPVAFLLLFFAGLILALIAVGFLAKRRLETMQELERQRTLLMQLTTHQLGAPLATFKWWMEIFHDREDAKAQEKRLNVEMLEEGITRMDAIMKSLQEAYQVFSGEVEYAPKQTSLASVIRTTAAETEKLCQTRGIHLALSIEQDLPSMLLDAKLVAAVLRELIDNAITYSPQDSTIIVRARPTLHGVEVQVQDSGIGIPAKDLPRIFERFSRGSNAMKVKPVGNGLGLFTARGIIRRAGGDMWVESEEGRGTVVTFTLPKEK